MAHFMTDNHQQDHTNALPHWQPFSQQVQQNQVSAYDTMRQTYPIAYDDDLGVSVFRHADVMQILNQPEIFSNRVSNRHIAVPNGMDAPVHTAFRTINDKYFTAERMATFAPIAKRIIDDLVQQLPKRQPVDVMASFAKTYAVKLQSAFMGWSDDYEMALNDWIAKNHQAIRQQDRELIGKVALEFDEFIKQILNEKRQNQDKKADITTELLHDVIHLPDESRHMTDDELVSLIRNWTVGELSTISATVGVITHFLATHIDEQERLRANPNDIPNAVEEIMRLNDPLVSNRRMTTCPVQLGGVDLPKGSKITINWIAANRDESVFDDATSYHPERNQQHNLVYGAGIHVCPGAPLARLELQLLLTSLLQHHIRPSEPRFSEPAIYPVSGFSKVSVILQ